MGLKTSVFYVKHHPITIDCIIISRHNDDMIVFIHYKNIEPVF